MFGFGRGGIDFTPETDIPDLAGKTIFVTGGNSGLGAESVKQLARHKPAAIFLAARTRSTAESTVAEIKKTIPSPHITIVELDLGSFASVRAAAAAFTGQSNRLDILLLNAGIAFNSEVAD